MKRASPADPARAISSATTRPVGGLLPARAAARQALLVLLLLTAVVACNRSRPPAPAARRGDEATATTGTARGPQQPQEAEAAVTITGCLERDRDAPDRIRLVTKGQLEPGRSARSGAPRTNERDVAPDQDVFELLPGPDVNLRQHLGRRVTITGVRIASGRVAPERGRHETSDESETRTLRVLSLDHVSRQSCR